jgi:FkbM family methyltransferase
MWLLKRLLTPSIPTDAVANPGTVVKAQRAERTQLSMPVTEIVADARVREKAGRYAESLALINRALAASPGTPALLFAKASILFAWGRFRESYEIATRADAIGLRGAEIYLLLGWSSFRVGKLSDAEAWMRKAVAAAPDAWEPHFNLAVVLQTEKRTNDAIRSYERALAQHPDNFDCLICLGNCHLELLDALSAETYFRRAIATQGQRSDAWGHLGVALGRQDREDEAREAFEQCVQLETQAGAADDGFINLAINLRDAGRTQEALDLFEKNLKQHPVIFAHLSYAHALLKAGKLTEGWRHYEFRWLSEPLLSSRLEFGRPVWSGQDLRGKTLLLREEQGFGDTIQFIRYAPRIQALGATVLLRVGGTMESLARSFPGIDRVLGPHDPTPEFDYYIHPLSLPRVLGTEVASIPAEVPYLCADPTRVERWRPKLDSKKGLRVGLVWAGSPAHQRDRYRSMSLDNMAPLAELRGVCFVALQKGPPAEQVKQPPPGLEVSNLGPELEDFCDTAAVISQLDLVICVDTAVAHLAGALGKPVWLMLPQPPDFRWMEEREDSPWYPTMRLFRQRRRGDWNEVVARVKAALQERLDEASSATSNPSVSTPVGAKEAVIAPIPLADVSSILGTGFSAVAETRMGILQYLPDEPVKGVAIGWYGEYLQSQLELLTRIIRPGATVMEVVAGIGAHSVVLARAIGPNGHLFLYESREIVQQILRQNLAANRIANATLMKRALGQSNGPAANARNDTALAGNTIAQNQGATETLDELLLDRLDWLKINDGSIALQVLEGATDTLWRLRPALFITTRDEAMLTALKNRMLEFSYRCWRMETALFNPENFNRRDTDLFSGRTSLALLAIPEEVDVDIVLDGCVELW